MYNFEEQARSTTRPDPSFQNNLNQATTVPSEGLKPATTSQWPVPRSMGLLPPNYRPDRLKNNQMTPLMEGGHYQRPVGRPSNTNQHIVRPQPRTISMDYQTNCNPFAYYQPPRTAPHYVAAENVSSIGKRPMEFTTSDSRYGSNCQEIRPMEGRISNYHRYSRDIPTTQQNTNVFKEAIPSQERPGNNHHISYHDPSKKDAGHFNCSTCQSSSCVHIQRQAACAYTPLTTLQQPTGTWTTNNHPQPDLWSMRDESRQMMPIEGIDMTVGNPYAMQYFERKKNEGKVNVPIPAAILEEAYKKQQAESYQIKKQQINKLKKYREHTEIIQQGRSLDWPQEEHGNGGGIVQPYAVGRYPDASQQGGHISRTVPAHLSVPIHSAMPSNSSAYKLPENLNYHPNSHLHSRLTTSYTIPTSNQGEMTKGNSYFSHAHSNNYVTPMSNHVNINPEPNNQGFSKPSYPVSVSYGNQPLNSCNERYENINYGQSMQVVDSSGGNQSGASFQQEMLQPYKPPPGNYFDTKPVNSVNMPSPQMAYSDLLYRNSMMETIQPQRHKMHTNYSLVAPNGANVPGGRMMQNGPGGYQQEAPFVELTMLDDSESLRKRRRQGEENAVASSFREPSKTVGEKRPPAEELRKFYENFQINEEFDEAPEPSHPAEKRKLQDASVLECTSFQDAVNATQPNACDAVKLENNAHKLDLRVEQSYASVIKPLKERQKSSTKLMNTLRNFRLYKSTHLNHSEQPAFSTVHLENSPPALQASHEGMENGNEMRAVDNNLASISSLNDAVGFAVPKNNASVPDSVEPSSAVKCSMMMPETISSKINLQIISMDAGDKQEPSEAANSQILSSLMAEITPCVPNIQDSLDKMIHSQNIANQTPSENDNLLPSSKQSILKDMLVQSQALLKPISPVSTENLPDSLCSLHHCSPPRLLPDEDVHTPTDNSHLPTIPEVPAEDSKLQENGFNVLTNAVSTEHSKISKKKANFDRPTKKALDSVIKYVSSEMQKSQAKSQQENAPFHAAPEESVSAVDLSCKSENSKKENATDIVASPGDQRTTREGESLEQVETERTNHSVSESSAKDQEKISDTSQVNARLLADDSREDIVLELHPSFDLSYSGDQDIVSSVHEEIEKLETAGHLLKAQGDVKHVSELRVEETCTHSESPKPATQPIAEDCSTVEAGLVPEKGQRLAMEKNADVKKVSQHAKHTQEENSPESQLLEPDDPHGAEDKEYVLSIEDDNSMGSLDEDEWLSEGNIVEIPEELQATEKNLGRDEPLNAKSIVDTPEEASKEDCDVESFNEEEPPNEENSLEVTEVLKTEEIAVLLDSDELLNEGENVLEESEELKKEESDVELPEELKNEENDMEFLDEEDEHPNEENNLLDEREERKNEAPELPEGLKNEENDMEFLDEDEHPNEENNLLKKSEELKKEESDVHLPAELKNEENDLEFHDEDNLLNRKNNVEIAEERHTEENNNGSPGERQKEENSVAFPEERQKEDDNVQLPEEMQNEENIMESMDEIMASPTENVPKKELDMESVEGESRNKVDGSREENHENITETSEPGELQENGTSITVQEASQLYVSRNVAEEALNHRSSDSDGLLDAERENVDDCELDAEVEACDAIYLSDDVDEVDSNAVETKRAASKMDSCAQKKGSELFARANVDSSAELVANCVEGECRTPNAEVDIEDGKDGSNTGMEELEQNREADFHETNQNSECAGEIEEVRSKDRAPSPGCATGFSAPCDDLHEAAKNFDREELDKCAAIVAEESADASGTKKSVDTSDLCKNSTSPDSETEPTEEWTTTNNDLDEPVSETKSPESFLNITAPESRNHNEDAALLSENSCLSEFDKHECENGTIRDCESMKCEGLNNHDFDKKSETTADLELSSVEARLDPRLNRFQRKIRKDQSFPIQEDLKSLISLPCDIIKRVDFDPHANFLDSINAAFKNLDPLPLGEEMASDLMNDFNDHASTELWPKTSLPTVPANGFEKPLDSEMPALERSSIISPVNSESLEMPCLEVMSDSHVDVTSPDCSMQEVICDSEKRVVNVDTDEPNSDAFSTLEPLQNWPYLEEEVFSETPRNRSPEIETTCSGQVYSPTPSYNTDSDTPSSKDLTHVPCERNIYDKPLNVLAKTRSPIPQLKCSLSWEKIFNLKINKKSSQYIVTKNKSGPQHKRMSLSEIPDYCKKINGKKGKKSSSLQERGEVSSFDLELGPATIKVRRTPNGTFKQWNVMDTVRTENTAETTLREENNNVADSASQPHGLKSPIVVAQRILIKRRAQELNGSISNGLDCPQGSSCLTTPPESDDSSPSQKALPKVVIKRTRHGNTKYQSFLRLSEGIGSRWQPVVQIERSQLIENMLKKNVQIAKLPKENVNKENELFAATQKVKQNVQATPVVKAQLSSFAESELFRARKPERTTTENHPRKITKEKRRKHSKVTKDKASPKPIMRKMCIYDRVNTGSCGAASDLVKPSHADNEDSSTHEDVKKVFKHSGRRHSDGSTGKKLPNPKRRKRVSSTYELSMPDTPTEEPVDACASKDRNVKCLKGDPREERREPAVAEGADSGAAEQADGIAAEIQRADLGTCRVCAFVFADDAEKLMHVKTHSYHCQKCREAFKSELEFESHLFAVHPDTKELHHCRLCQLCFASAAEHASHVTGRAHSRLELTQRWTIQTLFTMLTGAPCSQVAPLTDAEATEMTSLPVTEPGAINYYHQATPLQLAVQDLLSRGIRSPGSETLVNRGSTNKKMTDELHSSTNGDNQSKRNK